MYVGRGIVAPSPRHCPDVVPPMHPQRSGIVPLWSRDGPAHSRHYPAIVPPLSQHRALVPTVTGSALTQGLHCCIIGGLASWRAARASGEAAGQRVRAGGALTFQYKT